MKIFKKLKFKPDPELNKDFVADEPTEEATFTRNFKQEVTAKNYMHHSEPAEEFTVVRTNHTVPPKETIPSAPTVQTQELSDFQTTHADMAKAAQFDPAHTEVLYQTEVLYDPDATTDINTNNGEGNTTVEAQDATVKSEIFTPASYDEIQPAVDQLLTDRAILLDVTACSAKDRLRIRSFLSGILYVCDGNFVKVEDNVYKFAINHKVELKRKG